MKAFRNVNARDLPEAVSLLQQAMRDGRRAVLSGGGTDLLGMIKERLVQPDVLVNLRTVKGLEGIHEEQGRVRIGGLMTLAALGRHPLVTREFRLLADAAASVGTPQIRNAATLAGNVCQRPWCWYLRNGFPCYKNGGERCFATTGEHQFHAIFGGGPSYIVHPSDTAPALVALDASFRILGPGGERLVPAGEFFALPRQDPARENVLKEDEMVVEVVLPRPSVPPRSTYRKLLDREAWTHALVSAAVALDMDGDVCRRARIVLGGVAPVPWDLPEVAALLAGRRMTPDLADEAGRLAVKGARPLPKNAYKVPLTRTLVTRTIRELAS